MDSDDDFGDFTSVPVEAWQHDLKDVPPKSEPAVASGWELDVGKNPTIAVATSAVKAVESNSDDDDWGDFVEHSSSAGWDNSLAFDWFTTTQRSSPSEAFPAGGIVKNSSLDCNGGFWIGPSEVQLQPTEQKATNLGSPDPHFFAGARPSSLNANETSLLQVDATDVDSNDTEAQQTTFFGQKMETPWRSVSGEINPSPIPLSLFGDTELNTETQLVDSASNAFQVHIGNRAVNTNVSSSDSKELSNLIGNLYTEAQPPSNANHTISIPFENSMTVVNDFLGYPNSGASASPDLEESMLTLNLCWDHASETVFSKEDIHVAAGEEQQLQEVNASFRLDALSEADKCSFVEAWASILAVCASELELALKIWKQAQGAGVHLALLSDLQGKRYFAAIGQIYVVALILAVTSNVYKPWLQVALNNGKTLLVDLERCKTVWLETNLKEGVRLALDGLEGFMPTSVVSWKGIEQFSRVALEAYLQAARASVHSICKICLLPTAPFSCTGLSLIKWSGSSYLLPLANIWANCISQEPPLTGLSSQQSLSEALIVQPL